MKKVLTIAAVLVMILALSLNAFAAPSPVKGTSDTVDQGDGTAVVMTGIPAAQLPDQDGLNALVKSLFGDSDTLKLVAFDIAYSGTLNGPTALKVPFEKLALLGVLHYFNGAWIQESANQAEGTITVSGMSPFVFVYDTAASAPAAGTPAATEPAPAPGGTTPAPAPGGTTPAPVGPQRSPQTGYNTVLWIVMAAAMVSLAGYCFVSARKKVEE
jgi:hypothetical protein